MRLWLHVRFETFRRQVLLNSANMNHRQTIPIILLTAVLMGAVLFASTRADAATAEGRTYIDLEYTVFAKRSDVVSFALKPFVRLETRFRDSGMVYEQWNTGLRIGILPWLSTAAYYTPRLTMYPGTPGKFKNVAGADVIFHPQIGPFKLIDRIANEWHATDGFYRFRNLSEFIFKVADWAAIYFYEEFRIDADQRKVNMNNAGAGLQFDPLPVLTLRLFYDFEINRRGLPEWQYVHFIGILMYAHFR